MASSCCVCPSARNNSPTTCAAQAHQHILVQKHHDEQTESELLILTDSAQVDELARMSGGVTITDVTRDHARSLLTDVK